MAEERAPQVQAWPFFQGFRRRPPPHTHTHTPRSPRENNLILTPKVNNLQVSIQQPDVLWGYISPRFAEVIENAKREQKGKDNDN